MPNKKKEEKVEEAVEEVAEVAEVAVVEEVVEEVEVEKPKRTRKKKGPELKTILVGKSEHTGVVHGDTLMTAEGVGFAYHPDLEV